MKYINVFLLLATFAFHGTQALNPQPTLNPNVSEFVPNQATIQLNPHAKKFRPQNLHYLSITPMISMTTVVTILNYAQNKETLYTVEQDEYLDLRVTKQGLEAAGVTSHLHKNNGRFRSLHITQHPKKRTACINIFGKKGPQEGTIFVNGTEPTDPKVFEYRLPCFITAYGVKKIKKQNS